MRSLRRRKKLHLLLSFCMIQDTALFSHALKAHYYGYSHEDLSLLLMRKLNEAFNGRLTLASRYSRGNIIETISHELIAGQMDMDRLDYLRRDSFFTE